MTNQRLVAALSRSFNDDVVVSNGTVLSVDSDGNIASGVQSDVGVGNLVLEAVVEDNEIRVNMSTVGLDALQQVVDLHGSSRGSDHLDGAATAVGVSRNLNVEVGDVRGLRGNLDDYLVVVGGLRSELHNDVAIDELVSASSGSSDSVGTSLAVLLLGLEGVAVVDLFNLDPLAHVNGEVLGRRAIVHVGSGDLSALVESLGVSVEIDGNLEVDLVQGNDLIVIVVELDIDPVASIDVSEILGLVEIGELLAIGSTILHAREVTDPSEVLGIVDADELAAIVEANNVVVVVVLLRLELDSGNILEQLIVGAEGVQLVQTGLGQFGGLEVGAADLAISNDNVRAVAGDGQTLGAKLAVLGEIVSVGESHGHRFPWCW